MWLVGAFRKREQIMSSNSLNTTHKEGHKNIQADASTNTSPLIFFALVFVLAVPFWVIGPLADRVLHTYIPINLPISALWFVSPITAAAILTYREKGSDGVKKLLRRVVDYRQIQNKIWYLPIFCLWLVMIVLAYGLMDVLGASLPDDPQFSVLMVPIFFGAFFVSAVCEEVGWQGYAIDRLQDRWSAVAASGIVGIVWALGHIVPFIQLHHTPPWIVWQCLGMVPFRILIVWLYNNTRKSIFAAVVFHAMSNVSQFSFPNNGSYYDPFFAFLMLVLTAAIVIVVWGPETLARYRYARLSGSIEQQA
jgi:CAAX protease family protein